ncbi:response regulator transcription factor [Paenibacillus cremeus]|uniref:Response regulator n=1 Tax=Paenibacillus cremeus TaxID=2163881 RepID=A0A559K4D2_9BACL|nr:response regulator [Paenibacillus cremeus]TVY06984.1 response regulator [Paenibacillus cremeus]
MRYGKVLIVEDQPNFRKGLVKMIEDGAFGWSVVGEASNGQDALELLEQVKPDLVLTDIRMPIMDGLEFVGHLRRTHPDLLVIILTGYKNFEYAQAAVRHGALDLLIKPCTEQDVRQVLQKASDRFYERYAQQQKLLVQQQQQQDQELRAALLDLPSERGAAGRLNAFLADKELWLLQLDFAGLGSKIERKGDLGLLQFALSNITMELLKGAETEGGLLLVENDRFVLVTGQGKLEEHVREAIREACKHYLGIGVTMYSMGLAPASEQLSQLYRSIKRTSAAAAANVEPVREGGGVAEAQLHLNQARVKELEMQLMSAILRGQVDSLQELLERMLVELSNKTLEEMKLGALTLSIALHETVQKQFEPGELGAVAGIPCDMPQTDMNSSEVMTWAAEQVKLFMLLLSSWQASKSENLIERAIKYIAEHYSEELRLSDVAAQIHLNPSYFSVLFKKATGESFTRYVTRFRMEKAALLLRHSDMKIFEIANAVGFDEPNYFTNVFKQQYQMSPKEYRNMTGV